MYGIFPRSVSHPPRAPPYRLLMIPGLASMAWRGPHQRHLTFEDIDELRQFVKTGPSQETADASDSGVPGQFVNADAFAAADGMLLGVARNQLLYIFLVYARVVIYVH